MTTRRTLSVLGMMAIVLSIAAGRVQGHDPVIRLPREARAATAPRTGATDCQQKFYDGSFETAVGFSAARRAANIAQRFTVAPSPAGAEWFLDDVCAVLGRGGGAGTSRVSIAVFDDDQGRPGGLLGGRTVEVTLPAQPAGTLCVVDLAVGLAGLDAIHVALSWDPSQQSVFVLMDESPGTPLQVTSARFSNAGPEGLGAWSAATTLSAGIRAVGMGITLRASEAGRVATGIGGASAASAAVSGAASQRRGVSWPGPRAGRDILPASVLNHGSNPTAAPAGLAARRWSLPVYEPWAGGPEPPGGPASARRSTLSSRAGGTPRGAPFGETLLGGVAVQLHAGADTLGFVVVRDDANGEHSFHATWFPTDRPQDGRTQEVSTPLGNARSVGDDIVGVPGSDLLFFSIVESGTGTLRGVHVGVPAIGRTDFPTFTFETLAPGAFFNADAFVLGDDLCVAAVRTDFSLHVLCNDAAPGQGWVDRRSIPNVAGTLNGALGPETIAFGDDVCVFYSQVVSQAEFTLTSLCPGPGGQPQPLVVLPFRPFATGIDQGIRSWDDSLEWYTSLGLPRDAGFPGLGETELSSLVWQDDAALALAILEYHTQTDTVELIETFEGLQTVSVEGQTFDWFTTPMGPDRTFAFGFPGGGEDVVSGRRWRLSGDGTELAVELVGDFLWSDGEVGAKGTIEAGPPDDTEQEVVDDDFSREELELGLLVGSRAGGNSSSGSLRERALAPGSLVAVERRIPRPCVASESAHCLGGDRFEVAVDWRTDKGESGVGKRVDLTEESGLFYFFNPENLELIAKVLDACAGPFQSHWVFSAGLTDVEYVMRVFDAQSGSTRFYVNPQKHAALSVLDTKAFRPCVSAGAALLGDDIARVPASRSTELPSWAREALAARGSTAAPAPPGGEGAAAARAPDCTPGPTTLCLTQGRFRVEVEFVSDRSGSGDGQAIPLTPDTGAFWFFNATNVEVLVKVLDACSRPSHRFWVFAAGPTNVEVTLTVTDTSTGAQKVYDNPLDHPFEPVQDIQAFDTCP
jgi:hypothetical protein